MKYICCAKWWAISCIMVSWLWFVISKHVIYEMHPINCIFRYNCNEMCNQHKSLGYVRFINDMSTWHQLHPSNKPWLFINQDEWISKSLTTWKLLSNSPSDPHFQLQPIEMLLGVQHGQGVLRLVLKRGL